MHFIFKILDHLYCHSSEFFFWWTPYLLLFGLGWWVFVIFLHLLNVSQPFHFFHIAVCGALSAGWKVVVPLHCGVCSLWVGLEQWLVSISWLGELMSVLVDGAGSLLWSAVKGPVVNFGVPMGLVRLWAGRLLMFKVVALFC